MSRLTAPILVLCAGLSLAACDTRGEKDPIPERKPSAAGYGALSAAATPGPAPAHTVTGPNWEAVSHRYRCEDGAELQVGYLNLESGESFAAIVHEGRLHLAQQRVIASGARYIALDEQHSLRWHTKGDDGSLSFLAADHTAQEEVLLRECRAVRPDTGPGTD